MKVLHLWLYVLFYYFVVFPIISENIGSNDPFDDPSVKHRSDNLAQMSIEKTKFTFLSVDKHEGVKKYSSVVFS